MLKEYLDEEKHLAKKEGVFRISEVGEPLGIILDRHRGLLKESFSPRTRRILDNGKDVHGRILKRLYALGFVVCAEVEIPPNELFRGRADAILALPDEGNFLLEVKSVNPRTFALETPLLSHVWQAQLYLHFLNIPKGILLYENKATQELKEFLIQKDKWEIRRILNRFTRLKEILEAEREKKK